MIVTRENVQNTWLGVQHWRSEDCGTSRQRLLDTRRVCSALKQANYYQAGNKTEQQKSEGVNHSEKGNTGTND